MDWQQQTVPHGIDIFLVCGQIFFASDPSIFVGTIWQYYFQTDIGSSSMERCMELCK